MTLRHVLRLTCSLREVLGQACEWLEVILRLITVLPWLCWATHQRRSTVVRSQAGGL